MAKIKFPRISGNSLFDKSIWVAVMLGILYIIGIGVAQSTLSLTLPFLTALVVVFIVNYVYDYLNSAKAYHIQSLIASILVVVLAYSIITLLGTNISQGITIIGFVELVIVATVLEYIGIVIGKELKL